MPERIAWPSAITISGKPEVHHGAAESTARYRCQIVVCGPQADLEAIPRPTDRKARAADTHDRANDDLRFAAPPLQQCLPQSLTTAAPRVADIEKK